MTTTRKLAQACATVFDRLPRLYGDDAECVADMRCGEVQHRDPMAWDDAPTEQHARKARELYHLAVGYGIPDDKPLLEACTVLRKMLRRCDALHEIDAHVGNAILPGDDAVPFNTALLFNHGLVTATEARDLLGFAKLTGYEPDDD